MTFLLGQNSNTVISYTDYFNNCRQIQVNLKSCFRIRIYTFFKKKSGSWWASSGRPADHTT